jgi:hypothetical protein
MRPPWEWDESSIRELIASQVQESLTLDYKACDALARTDAKKREISKDVSAFANSAGGTIVYGVLEDKYFPTKIDAGYLPAEISKEWLEQVIQGTIQRRIDGVRINPVRLSGEAAGRVLYVVSIPQSMRAPHMAVDHRFYKRFNFESVPMEEYEVRDASRRGDSPDLRLDVELRVPDDPDSSVELSFFLVNEAPEPANHAVIVVFVDVRAKVLSAEGWMTRGQHPFTISGVETIPAQALQRNWGLPHELPIWQGQRFILNQECLVISLPMGSGEYVFGWQLSSPRMPIKHRQYSIIYNGGAINIEERGAEAAALGSLG